MEYCADCHNRHQVGQDGLTPWQRLKGKKSHGYIQEFGRSILHRVPGELAGGLMQPRFFSGVYLGNRQETNEIIVSIENGETVKARDFKEVPDNGAWSAEALRSV